MKKTNWLVILLAVVGLAMVPVMTGAQAQDLSIDQLGCRVLNVDGEDTIFMDTSQIHTVQTFSSNNNVNATCHGDLVDGLPDHAVVFQGRDYQPNNPSGNPERQCAISIILDDGTSKVVRTSNWHQVITPSGNVTLTCHFKAKEIPQ